MCEFNTFYNVIQVTSRIENNIKEEKKCFKDLFTTSKLITFMLVALCPNYFDGAILQNLSNRKCSKIFVLNIFKQEHGNEFKNRYLVF